MLVYDGCRLLSIPIVLEQITMQLQSQLGVRRGVRVIVRAQGYVALKIHMRLDQQIAGSWWKVIEPQGAISRSASCGLPAPATAGFVAFDIEFAEPEVEAAVLGIPPSFESGREKPGM
jgi:hypothetical protein